MLAKLPPEKPDHNVGTGIGSVNWIISLLGPSRLRGGFQNYEKFACSIPGNSQDSIVAKSK